MLCLSTYVVHYLGPCKKFYLPVCDRKCTFDHKFAGTISFSKFRQYVSETFFLNYNDTLRESPLQRQECEVSCLFKSGYNFMKLHVVHIKLRQPKHHRRWDTSQLITILAFFFCLDETCRGGTPVSWQNIRSVKNSKKPQKNTLGKKSLSSPPHLNEKGSESP